MSVVKRSSDFKNKEKRDKNVYLYKPDSRRRQKGCLAACFDDDHNDFDNELIQILSERKEKKVASSASATEHLYNAFKGKRDGCTESGYLSQPHALFHHTSMEILRRSFISTKNLPGPEIAIKLNNSRQFDDLPLLRYGHGEETNVSEINQMLVHRLSGTVTLEDDNPNESGEALLSYREMSSHMQPLVISHLVNDTNLKRMSVSADVDRNRRRSSFSLRGVDLSISKTLHEAASSIHEKQINKESDADFIKNLPNISRMIKHELEGNLSHTQRYIKKLKAVLKDPEFVKMIDQKSKQESWLVILYTSSDGIQGSLTEFDCNLVRLILQHHLIVYEERDIGLRKEPFRSELQDIMKSDSLIVPYVCAKGVCVGGVQVIFVMHKMNVIKDIFKDFIISPELYVDWLYNRTRSPCVLTLNVKISSYPTLKQMLSHQHKTRLTSKDREISELGKYMLKTAKAMWQNLTKVVFTQPSLLKLVLLRNTIVLTYTLLNLLYYDYLPGHYKAERLCQCCG